MILVREIFEVKFGKMKDALGLVKEANGFMNPQDHDSGRVCTDMTGPFYTLVLESTFKNLTDYEDREKSISKNGDWKEWYSKFVPLIDNGRREIYSIVENSR